MPKRSPEVLPPEVEKELEAVGAIVRHAFFLAANGSPEHEALAEIIAGQGLLDPGLEAAYKVGREKLPPNWVAPRAVTFEDIAASRLRTFRLDNGRTQAEFAADVSSRTRLPWKRGTVA